MKRRIIIFILTDPTIVSINHIQQAHKKADNGFNDLVAQLYKHEFKVQEKANKERVDAAKHKAIELQRIEEESRKAAEQKAEQLRREDVERKLRDEQAAKERAETDKAEAERKASEERANLQQNAITTSGIGSTWSSVSPQQAAAYMASKTGVSQGTWEQIIYRESTNNPTVINSIGCFGYLQLHPVHGNVSSMTPQQYLDTAVGVYNSQGLAAWEVVTLGMVN